MMMMMMTQVVMLLSFLTVLLVHVQATAVPTFSSGISPLPSPPATALSPDQLKETLNAFLNAFIAPNDVAQAKEINSTFFADDVIGTVDLSTTFVGRELNTEYTFGLFAILAQSPTDPALYGQPVSANVTALVIQGQTVALGMIVMFNYLTLNKAFPVEIDGFFTFNDQSKIQQYDVTFRRYAWASQIITPQLIPLMAKAINISSTNGTYVLQQYLATRTCQGAEQYCTGDNKQYDSYDSCMSFATSIDLGEAWRLGDNNLNCRYLHTAMLPLRPSVHCPHVGPSGGDMCIPRDYDAVVYGSAFQYGLDN
ncbi:hypothetical protein BCR39DRAFT_362087 [Naematelia encephala]|uniref:Secreted protein n=1 Tax=Naematelia encephala TaxID=71784 RepID=A0A1Y2AL16_9TREE|nr:hypothetical protein BCR39DRAFT_362087 [Naematelia encephala]